MNELTKWGERNERINEMRANEMNEMTKFLSSFISFVLRSKYVEGGGWQTSFRVPDLNY